MPCNSDYMSPNSWEIQLSKVRAFLDELKTGKLNKKHLEGYHPKVYLKGVEKRELDFQVRKLCNELQHEDVKKYSLEMQLWWRDHQEADNKRREKEKAEEQRKAKKEAIKKKLTKAEITFLGLDKED